MVYSPTNLETVLTATTKKNLDLYTGTDHPKSKLLLHVP